ncbi:MAG TPA: cation transporter, partial [Actinomycetota bacterium]|nr:cation transporter [Actinomycetota bacterium]
NAAEHSSAVVLAMKDRMDVSIEIAIGSSVQLALFVAPVLVFASLAVGQPMDFIFTGYEIAAVGFSSVILAFIALDGRSNWLEGAQLLAAYVIVAISFFFL